jgi:hypothetical protein
MNNRAPGQAKGRDIGEAPNPMRGRKEIKNMMKCMENSLKFTFLLVPRPQPEKNKAASCRII